VSALPEFKTADLPEKKAGFWKLAGPGAVLVGLSIGAGEIVIWPRIVAEYGATMIWAAGVGLILQLWINLEIARWTIATGESVYTGYCRVWRGFAYVFILLNLLAWLAPGWGRASGLALKALLVGPQGFGSDTFWTVVTFVGVAVILFGPKLAYHAVEKTIEALVILVTIGLIIVAVLVGTADTWVDLGRGLLNIPYRDPGMTVKALFIALVFAGAGGTANLFYSYYLRDKQIGMGARVPPMANPLRGGGTESPGTGYRYEDTPTNAKRFRSWFRHIIADQTVFFWGLNSITLLLFAFASLAILHPRGQVPAAGTLIWDEAVILEEIWGLPGRYIFLMVGLATLFSTQLAIVDGVSRSIADIIHVNFPAAQKRSMGWWYLVIAGVWMIVGCAITAVMEAWGVTELGFLFNAAYMGGFAMAIYTPLTLYMNWRYLPPSARPGPLQMGIMFIVSCVYIGFAVACLWWEVVSRLMG
jgi:hypothetical protein